MAEETIDSVMENIRSKHLSARKARDSATLEALGPLLGDIETKQKGTGTFDLSALYGIVRSHINGLRECILNTEGNSLQVENMENQVKILSGFLPQKMSGSQMVDIASEVLKSKGEGANLGTVMAHFKEKYPGMYDGKVLSEIVKDLLQ